MRSGGGPGFGGTKPKGKKKGRENKRGKGMRIKEENVNDYEKMLNSNFEITHSQSSFNLSQFLCPVPILQPLVGNTTYNELDMIWIGFTPGLDLLLFHPHHLSVTNGK